jgi:hypothetical protein
MATHKFITCDRCGKQFEYANEKWATILRAMKLKKFRATKLFYGNPSGYDYSEYSFDLCRECSDALDKFLEGGKE